MHLLSLTIQPPTNVSTAVVGSFSGAKGQEILCVRGGTRLEVLKLNTQSGQCEYQLFAYQSTALAHPYAVETVCSTEVSYESRCGWMIADPLSFPGIRHSEGCSCIQVSGDVQRCASCLALSCDTVSDNALSTDYILLSSDSGRMSIIEFVVAPTPHFESLYQEVYGKTGSRWVSLRLGAGV